MSKSSKYIELKPNEFYIFCHKCGGELITLVEREYIDFLATHLKHANLIKAIRPKGDPNEYKAGNRS